MLPRFTTHIAQPPPIYNNPTHSNTTYFQPTFENSKAISQPPKRSNTSSHSNASVSSSNHWMQRTRSMPGAFQESPSSSQHSDRVLNPNSTFDDMEDISLTPTQRSRRLSDASDRTVRAPPTEQASERPAKRLRAEGRPAPRNRSFVRGWLESQLPDTQFAKDFCLPDGQSTHGEEPATADKEEEPEKSSQETNRSFSSSVSSSFSSGFSAESESQIPAVHRTMINELVFRPVDNSRGVGAMLLDMGNQVVGRYQYLPCTRATEADAQRVQRNSKQLDKFYQSKKTQSNLTNRLQYMVDAELNAAEQEKRRAASVVELAGRLQDFLQRISDERVATGESARWVNHELEWAEWVVDAAKSGVLHLKTRECKCRDHWRGYGKE